MHKGAALLRVRSWPRRSRSVEECDRGTGAEEDEGRPPWHHAGRARRRLSADCGSELHVVRRPSPSPWRVLHQARQTRTRGEAQARPPPRASPLRASPPRASPAPAGAGVAGGLHKQRRVSGGHAWRSERGERRWALGGRVRRSKGGPARGREAGPARMEAGRRARRPSGAGGGPAEVDLPLRFALRCWSPLKKLLALVTVHMRQTRFVYPKCISTVGVSLISIPQMLRKRVRRQTRMAC